MYENMIEVKSKKITIKLNSFLYKKELVAKACGQIDDYNFKIREVKNFLYVDITPKKKAIKNPREFSLDFMNYLLESMK